jgi:hypothetical protein
MMKPTKQQQELLDSMDRHGPLTVGRSLSPVLYRSFMALIRKGYARVEAVHGDEVTFFLA